MLPGIRTKWQVTLLFAFSIDITKRNSAVKLSDVSGKWADILWEVLSFAPNGIFYFRFNSCSLKAFPSAWVTQTVQPRINQNKHSWTSSLACQSTLCVFCCCHGANSVPVGSRNHIITETSSSPTQSEKLFHFSGNIPLWKIDFITLLQRAHITEIIYFNTLYLKSTWNKNGSFFGF